MEDIKYGWDYKDDKYTMHELKVMYEKGEIQDDNWFAGYNEEGKAVRWFPGTYIRDCIRMNKELNEKQMKHLWNITGPNKTEKHESGKE